MLEQDIQQLAAAVKELTAAIREQAANLSGYVNYAKTVGEPGIIIDQEPDPKPDPKPDTPEPAPVKAEAPQPEPAPVKAEAPQSEQVKEAAKPKAEEPASEPKTEEPKSEVPDEELLKGMLKDLYSKKGGDAVANTMSKFGVSRLGNVPLEQRAELKAAIEEALA